MAQGVLCSEGDWEGEREAGEATTALYSVSELQEGYLVFLFLFCKIFTDRTNKTKKDI